MYERITGEDPYQVPMRIFPATHYVAGPDRMVRAVRDIEAELAERLAEFESQGKLLEAQRLKLRTEYDMEMIRQVGFSLLDMKQFLEASGYQADGFRLSIDDLASMNKPAIVMMDTAGYKHFVIFKGDRAGRVLIGDPALGLKTYSREQFTSMWNGVAFVIREPAERFNQATEWTPWNQSRPWQALPNHSLAELTRELPPLYQVTTRFSLDPYLR